MQPILIVLIAVAASVPLGLWLRRNLATLSYRKDDEVVLPAPGPRWWVVWVSVLATGTLAAVAVLSRAPLAYVPLVPLAVIGPWLAAVDFDVLRIPNRVLGPTAAATALVILSVSAATQDLRILISSSLGALVVGAVFGAVHLASRGGIGFGDVKLAALVAGAAGSLGVTAVWLSVVAGSLTALVWANACRRKGLIPYGPWLMCGAWITALWTMAV